MPATSLLVNAGLGLIGGGARVDQSNALVLGSVNGVGGATADVNVGIGTTVPGARLEIAAEEFAPDARITVADGAPDIVGRSSGGTRAVPSVTGENSVLLALRGDGHTGSGFASGATVLLRGTDTWSTPAAAREWSSRRRRRARRPRTSA